MTPMLAAVIHGFDHLEPDEVPVPKPENLGEVVRSVSCGICATDCKAIKGIHRSVKFPLIAGHEPSGIVAEIGPGVTHFGPGDEVIVQPSGFCPRDVRAGWRHYPLPRRPDGR
jgi:D-arabinose 1-dehydrogenase-like Zn-dependent alcohol dehydrogenase